VIYPLLAPNYLINVGMMVFFVAFIGQSWNIAGGFAGQTSFGHACSSAPAPTPRPSCR
jgi:branched-chain amino acid transport system permease protein